MFIEEIIGAFTGQNRRNRNRQVAIGTFLGLLGGATVALMFAPKSGKETREDIKKCAAKGKAAASDLANQGYDFAKNWANLAADKIGEITSDLGEYSGLIIDEAGQKFGRTKRDAARKARMAGRKARQLGYDKAQALADRLKSDLEAEEELEKATANLEQVVTEEIK